MQDNSIHTSEAITHGIRIVVTAKFSHVDAQERRWHFIYTIRIANEGTDTVQLVSRHWIITNGSNEIEEVKGLGVVGDQPTLAPGQAFEYSSRCPLATPFGSLRGTYQMMTRDGTRFDVEIAEFALTEPYTIH